MRVLQICWIITKDLIRASLEPKAQERGGWTEKKYLEEITAENVLRLAKDICLQIQESKQIPKQATLKFLPRNIIKYLEVKDIENILTLPMKEHQLERQQISYLKPWSPGGGGMVFKY